MQATPEELQTAISLANEALAKIKAIQSGLTPNPEVDKLIGESYANMTKVSMILSFEYSITQ